MGARASSRRALTATEVTWSRVALPPPDADTEEGASALLRCTVMDPQPDPVGRAFTGPAVELALASYPGFTMTTPAAAADALRRLPAGVRRPRAGRTTRSCTPTAAARRSTTRPSSRVADPDDGPPPVAVPRPADSVNRRMPLGTFVHARSGDKGGDANIGLWVAHDGSTPSTTPGSPGWPS